MRSREIIRGCAAIGIELNNSPRYYQREMPTTSDHHISTPNQRYFETCQAK
jgi:hypothetical protein